MQSRFHAQQLLSIPLEHFCDRNARPSRNNLGNLLIGHPRAEQSGLRRLYVGSRDELAFQFGQHTVLYFRHGGEITGSTRDV